MTGTSSLLHLDAVIFGGGASGLWTLDELIRAGHDVLLLESGALGAGQTVASQGIIHGGLKYTLSGLLTPAARAIREMPELWRRCLAGESEPDLRHTRLRAEFCYLWRSRGLSGRLSMTGARLGLQVTPEALDASARPEVLAACPGDVARIDEQVIEPTSFIRALADRHRDRVLRYDPEHGLEFVTREPGGIDLVRLINPETGEPVDLRPAHVILTAGAGNGTLQSMAGLPSDRMQRRPLHMVMARGPLPWLNGHCVDGRTTRVTITSTHDCTQQTVWQIGGQIAETGVEEEDTSLVTRAQEEVRAVLPGIDLAGTEWSTYRVDRAEASTGGGIRPDGAQLLQIQNTITGWPTKLALAPQLAEAIRDTVGDPAPRNGSGSIHDQPTIRRWPRPTTALPPWELEATWSTVS